MSMEQTEHRIIYVSIERRNSKYSTQQAIRTHDGPSWRIEYTEEGDEVENEFLLR